MEAGQTVIALFDKMSWMSTDGKCFEHAPCKGQELVIEYVEVHHGDKMLFFVGFEGRSESTGFRHSYEAKGFKLKSREGSNYTSRNLAYAFLREENFKAYWQKNFYNNDWISNLK